MVNRVFCCC